MSGTQKEEKLHDHEMTMLLVGHLFRNAIPRLRTCASMTVTNSATEPRQAHLRKKDALNRRRNREISNGEPATAGLAS